MSLLFAVILRRFRYGCVWKLPQIPLRGSPSIRDDGGSPIGKGDELVGGGQQIRGPRIGTFLREDNLRPFVAHER